MAPLAMLWFRSESTVPYTSNRGIREGQSCQRFRNVVVTRVISPHAVTRIFAGFDHAEFVQISRLCWLARRPGLWRSVLARYLRQISAARDHRDNSARQVSQKSLM